MFVPSGTMMGLGQRVLALQVGMKLSLHIYFRSSEILIAQKCSNM